MDSTYIYFIGLLISFPIVFHTLYKLKFQELFDARKVWEIKVGYIIISLCICHILACIVEKFYILSNL